MPLGLEAFHIDIKNADALCVTLFRVAAQQLLSDADAQHGLLQVTDDLVQPALTQVSHRRAGLALSGEDYAVSLSELFRIVGQQRVDAQSLQRVHH